MSYESFRKNIDAIITPVLLIGLDGTIKMINRAFVEAAGLSSPALHYEGRTAEEILGKDLVKSCVDLAQKAISQKGSIKSFTFSRRSTSSEKIYWDVTVTQWLVDDLSDGVLLSFKEVGRDYSQSREHRFMDAIIDGARDALLIMTGDYRLKKINQTFLELFGGKPEDYLKHNLREFVFEFDRFEEETKQSAQGMPFHSVLRRQDNEPVNCETVARCYPASMFASSEQSGVSEVYWILELRALEEKDNRIVEVLSGKNRMLEERVETMKEHIAHLTQQLTEFSAKQNQEKDSEQDKDWADNLMEMAAELENLRTAKQEVEMRLRLLQNKYNNESQSWQKDKEGILIDHQDILHEKQMVTEKMQVLQDQHRIALEEQVKNHRSDLDKIALAQQMILDELKQKHAEELADNEAVHRDMCTAYEKSEQLVAELRHHLAAQQSDVPVAMSGQLLAGAVNILENVSDIFTESLSDLLTDLKDSPAVKNMVAANKDLEKLVGCLHLFDDAFLKTAPSRHSLLDTCQSWQEEFTRQYSDRDLYFKYPVDGEIIFYEPQVLAIVRKLLENAVEATHDHSNGEIKVKIQIKSSEEMANCHFKKEIDSHCLLVQVVDNGESLFDPEQAIKHYYTNKDGHFGLGLSTVRFLLESMGGELELRSTPNGGAATFYLPLP